MDFKVDADLILFLERMIMALEPYASAQSVLLEFHSSCKTYRTRYSPYLIVPKISALVCQIIAFTPQNQKVVVKFSPGKTEGAILHITNSGVNLSKVSALMNRRDLDFSVKSISKGTCFMVKIANDYDGTDTAVPNQTSIHSKPLPRYFKEIHKRLTNYFDNVSNIEAIAESKGQNEGIFIRKVNLVIQSNLDNASFTIDELANAMALSRTQLFRKIKCLTQMSPSTYLRFTRLHSAKELLQQQEGYNVSDVCYKVGFSSVSHFTRSFKKQFGATPSTFLVQPKVKRM